MLPFFNILLSFRCFCLHSLYIAKRRESIRKQPSVVLPRARPSRSETIQLRRTKIMKMSAFALCVTKEILRDPLNLAFVPGFPLAMLLLLSAIQANIPLPLFEISSLAPAITVFGLSFSAFFRRCLFQRTKSVHLKALPIFSPSPTQPSFQDLHTWEISRICSPIFLRCLSMRSPHFCLQSLHSSVKGRVGKLCYSDKTALKKRYLQTFVVKYRFYHFKIHAYRKVFSLLHNRIHQSNISL